MVRWTGLEAPRLGVLAGFAAMLVALLLLALASPSLILATPNPSGTGQPGAECGEENALVEPAGFLTDGFAHAEEMYAGSGASVDHAGSEHAVSQYDVACFQLSSR